MQQLKRAAITIIRYIPVFYFVSLAILTFFEISKPSVLTIAVGIFVSFQLLGYQAQEQEGIERENTNQTDSH